MVASDSQGSYMAANRYIQPDYVSPVSETMDAKKSPLALLAQTCSQIGADSSKTSSSSDKKKEDKKDKTPTSSTEPPRRSPAFKPYESSPPRKSERSEGADLAQRPSSKSGRSASTAAKEEGRRSAEASSTSPIIRSGLEVLTGRSPAGDAALASAAFRSSPFLPHPYPPFDTHPAFRGGLLPPGFPLSLSPYPGLYPSPYTASASSPYVSYTRVKTSGGGEIVIPVCRDPYCTGCPYSLQNNHLLLSGGSCPASCAQCDAAKSALAAVPGLASIPPSALVPASSLLPKLPYSPAPPTLPRPYSCPMNAGTSAACSKTFTSPEELLQHLRSHTTESPVSSHYLSSPFTSPLTSLAPSLPPSFSALQAQAALLQSLYRPPTFSPPTLSPTMSPSQLSRYHPYSKPFPLPPYHPGLPTP